MTICTWVLKHAWQSDSFLLRLPQVNHLIPSDIYDVYPKPSSPKTLGSVYFACRQLAIL